jgi:hypothetical protein
MIIFFENGRLGNQWIQYTGFKKFFPKEKLVFIGCESLFSIFDGVDAFFISKKKVGHRFYFIIFMKILFFLTKIRIFGKIIKTKQTNSYKISKKKGLFWKVFVIENFFFDIVDIENFKNPPLLKTHLVKQAKDWLINRRINTKTHSVVFVNVRRGDYLYWPSKQFPAVLSLDWYKRAMNLIKEKVQNPIFILISDDKYYLKDVFNESDNLYISENDFELDFSIMSLCKHGILSSSTFAWCGAYYANLNKEKETFFIAPKNWTQHRSQKITTDYISDFITYI